MASDPRARGAGGLVAAAADPANPGPLYRATEDAVVQVQFLAVGLDPPGVWRLSVHAGPAGGRIRLLCFARGTGPVNAGEEASLWAGVRSALEEARDLHGRGRVELDRGEEEALAVWLDELGEPAG